MRSAAREEAAASQRRRPNAWFEYASEWEITPRKARHVAAVEEGARPCSRSRWWPPLDLHPPRKVRWLWMVAVKGKSSTGPSWLAGFALASIVLLGRERGARACDGALG